MADEVFKIHCVRCEADAEIKTACPCDGSAGRLRRVQNQYAVIVYRAITAMCQSNAAYFNHRHTFNRQNRLGKAAVIAHKLVSRYALNDISDKLVCNLVICRVFVQKAVKTATALIEKACQLLKFVN